MSINPHPRAELSAYHDGALAPAERAAVDSHLATCDDCSARLAELRTVASLIGALPDPVPSRRLLPRVGTAPSWLAPLRTLTTLASGISVFMFIASALLTNVNQLAVPTSGQAAAPAAVAPGAGGSTTTERSTQGSPTSPSNQIGAPAADSAKAAATAAPSGAGFSVTATGTPQDAAARADQGAQREVSKAVPGPVGPSPLVWLALAIVLGAIAIALQRRLRSA